ncbi:MAG: hypothetical protein HQL23_04440 [Candidatus Omnitrophica bacterium]|nr:hypothetical protein [Candidatus Omnitrophota bacterium]
MTVIAIPQSLRSKLGDDAIQDLIRLLDTIETGSQAMTVQTVENKFEKRLIEETEKLRVEFHGLRADIVRWMFLFWIGQFAGVAGLLSWFKH